MAKLLWYGDKVLRKIERDSSGILRCICETIAEKARRIVPVKTGKLQRSIKAKEDSVEVTEEYAGFVEFGTEKMAAQPYLRPAIEQFSKEDLERCIK